MSAPGKAILTADMMTPEIRLATHIGIASGLFQAMRENGDFAGPRFIGVSKDGLALFDFPEAPDCALAALSFKEVKKVLASIWFVEDVITPEYAKVVDREMRNARWAMALGFAPTIDVGTLPPQPQAEIKEAARATA